LSVNMGAGEASLVAAAGFGWVSGLAAVIGLSVLVMIPVSGPALAFPWHSS
jgi:hypothetical protein